MRASYKSEFTQFLENLKEQKPGIEARQRAGRALLWDKRLDPELQEGFKQGRVPQKSYVYQTE